MSREVFWYKMKFFWYIAEGFLDASVQALLAGLGAHLVANLGARCIHVFRQSQGALQIITISEVF